MKNNQGLNDNLIKNKLLEEDPIELPMDDLFFDKLHDKIMASVEKTEIKPLSRWAKTWVFLEKKALYYRPSNNVTTMKVVTFSFVGVTMALGLSLGLASLSLLHQSNQVLTNQQMIVNQAQQSPQDWIELAGSVQNENDFIAEVINEKMTQDSSAQIEL